jgi:crotonobetainyl-CoA:carnitine CoA-transferase CaiB-like acyl-CoA transferase
MEAQPKNSSIEVTGPLSGYRILEFGANFTGPVAGMLLGDQGAEVIKVEPPTGDQMRYQASMRGGVSAIFLSVNRNKRSIVLDLRKPGAIEVFHRLARSSDVVVQNFRPGVVDRLHLGYEDLRKLREDLIYVSISGFGSVGPYASQRVYDTVIQGVAGVASAQRDPNTKIPCTVRSSIADKVTAYTVAQAITAALLSRERTGKGQHLSVNMLGAMLSFWWPDVMSNLTFVGPGASVAGSVGDISPIYQTLDGYVIAVCVSDAEWKGLTEAIGKPELADDPRFRTQRDRGAHIKELHEELKTAFALRSTEEWLTVLRELDAVSGPVNTLEHLCDDPQIRASGVIWEGEHPSAGVYREPIHPIDFADTQAQFRRHAPMLGEHTEDILRELGFQDEEIARMKEQGAIGGK